MTSTQTLCNTPAPVAPQDILPCPASDGPSSPASASQAAAVLPGLPDSTSAAAAPVIEAPPAAAMPESASPDPREELNRLAERARRSGRLQDCLLYQRAAAR